MFNFPFAEVRRDLVSRLYQIAYTLHTMQRGLGSAFLRLTEQEPLKWPEVDDYDLGLLGLQQPLASMYRYATVGEDDCTTGTSEFIYEAEEPMAQLRLFLDWSRCVVVDSTSHWLEDALGIVWDMTALEQMIAVVGARDHLDAYRPLTPMQLALLAQVDERTVRNAMHQEGEAGVRATRLADGSMSIEGPEAVRWLMRRPGFAPTTLAGQAAESRLPHPTAIGPEGLGAFVRQRILQLRPNAADRTERLRYILRQRADPPPFDPAVAISEAAANHFLGEARLAEVMADTGPPLNDLEIYSLARVLDVDRRWLQQQVRPRKSAARSAALPLTHVFDEAAGAVVVTLSAAGIANGYLDIPSRYAERLFPADAFGGRAGNAKGATVTLVVDGEAHASDIRRQSKALASPRKRFNGWFRRCGAQAGDRVRIERQGERLFVLQFVPAVGPAGGDIPLDPQEPA